MGIQSSSISFVRYSVHGEAAENFLEQAAEKIQAFSFRDIDDTVDDYSIGWVSAWNMFDSVLADHSSFLLGDYIVLALRIDERKVPSAVLKKCVLKEEFRIKKERSMENLNRYQVQELRESVRLSLMKKAVPVPAVYELAWNLADNTLMFFSTSAKAQALLEEYFYKTFSLRLMMQIPFVVGQHLLPEELRSRLEALTPITIMDSQRSSTPAWTWLL